MHLWLQVNSLLLGPLVPISAQILITLSLAEKAHGRKLSDRSYEHFSLLLECLKCVNVA